MELTDDFVMADHIEIDHERELAPGTLGLAEIHKVMHSNRDDWDHTHVRGQMVQKEN